ncbi:hypothetical protein CLF_107400, partial [Clonorchis sinensis]
VRRKHERPLTDLDSTEEDVRAFLHKTNPFSALGPDVIHPRILHEQSITLVGHFYLVFHQSLDKANPHPTWKEVIVTPTCKIGDRLPPCNRRHISITRVLCCQLRTQEPSCNVTLIEHVHRVALKMVVALNPLIIKRISWCLAAFSHNIVSSKETHCSLTPSLDKVWKTGFSPLTRLTNSGYMPFPCENFASEDSEWEATSRLEDRGRFPVGSGYKYAESGELNGGDNNGRGETGMFQIERVIAVRRLLTNILLMWKMQTSPFSFSNRKAHVLLNELTKVIQSSGMHFALTKRKIMIVDMQPLNTPSTIQREAVEVVAHLHMRVTDFGGVMEYVDFIGFIGHLLENRNLLHHLRSTGMRRDEGNTVIPNTAIRSASRKGNYSQDC